MNALSAHSAFWRLRYLIAIIEVMIAWNVSLAEQDAPSRIPFNYRRIFVPADSPAVWPTNGQTFLPVEANEFDAWIANANRPVANPSLVNTQYVARLEGERLVAGIANWQIELPDDRPGSLSWQPASFVAEHPVWTRSNQPAQLGLWASGAYGLRVPKSGELNFAWHSRPGRYVGGELHIPLELPAAQRSQFVLELPGNKVPVIVGGILTASEDMLETSGNWRRYKFALGNSTPRELRISDAADSSRTELPQALLHERLRYQLSPRGLDITANLCLEYNDQLPGELVFEIPRDVRLMSADCAGRPLNWRIEASDAGGRAFVTLSDPVPEGSAVVTLRAWSDLEDGRWQLPKLNTAGAFWSSGSFEIEVDDALELREVKLNECVQRGHARQSIYDGPSKPVVLDAYSPTAAVSVSVRPRATAAHVRKGMTLEVGNSSIAGRLVAQLSVDRGRLHSLSLGVRPGWQVESIETIPAEALAQWHVESQKGRDTIQLQFAESIAAGEAVTIVSTGRLQRDAPFGPLARELVTMLDWQSVTISRNLLRLRAAEPFELEPIGELAVISAADQTDDDRGLVAGPADEPIYDLQRAEPNLAVRLAPKRGVYNAEIEHDATLVGRTLKSEYRIVCRPQGSGIEEVLVYFSEPLEGEPHWIDADSLRRIHAVRAPAHDPRFGGLPPGGELWEIDLRGLYARPVIILARVESPWAANAKVPLASLPESEIQQGRIVVSTANQPAPAIERREMAPAPLPAPRDFGLPNAPTRALAVYHYAPVDFYSPSTPPSLSLDPDGVETGADQLVATDVAIESYYAGDLAVHRIRYELENYGASRVAFRLPVETRLESAIIDGASVPVIQAPNDQQTIMLRLTPQQSISLELRLRHKVGKLANGTTLLSPLPVSDEVAMLQGRWTVWLPDEFSVVGDALAKNRSFDWRQRLFGPIARPRTERIFNPLRSQDWRDLVPTGTAHTALAAMNANGTAIAPDGWQAFQTSFISAPPDSLSIIQPALTGTYALAAFLVSALSGTFFAIRIVPWIVAAAVSAIFCLLLPPAYAPIATGIFLGLLLAPVCRLAWEHLEPHQSNSHSTISVTRGLIGGTLVAVVVTVTFAAGVAAERSATPAVSAVEQVLVPTDKQLQRLGSKIYLSDVFLRELLRRSNHRTNEGGWVLRTLRCRGDITPRDDASTDAGSWTIVGDVETLTRDVTMKLPLRKSDAVWDANATLDGIATRLLWQDDGNGCALVIPEPGQHELILDLTPRQKQIGDRNVISLTLPPIFGAKLLLESSQPLSNLFVNGEKIIPRRTPTLQTWEHELDGSGSVKLNWHSAVTGHASPTVAIDELQWLRIDERGIELQLKYVVNDQEPVPEFVSVYIDDRWELIGKAHEPTTTDASGGRQSVRLPLFPVSDQRHEATARFRLRQPIAFGRLQVPGVRLAGLPGARRMLAVSCGPELECRPVSISQLGSGVENEFAAVWGETVSADVILNLAGTKPGWHLGLRPRSAATAATTAEDVATNSVSTDATAQAMPEDIEKTDKETDADVANSSPHSNENPRSDVGRRGEDSGRLARIRLCETTIYTGPRGGEFSTTRFVVDPQGLDECTMVLPFSQQLVRTKLDGDPPLSQHLEGQRWRVQLRSRNLPQILEVTTRRVGPSDDGDEIAVLRRPILEHDGEQIPFMIGLWSLCSPAAAVLPVAKAAAPLTSLEQVALRLDQMANISEGTTGTVVESSAVDGHNWFVRWRANLRASQAAARAQQQANVVATAATRVQTLDDPVEVAVMRIEAWVSEVQEALAATNEPVAAGTPLPGPASTADGVTWAHFVNDSQRPTLEIELIPTATMPSQSRTIAILSILVTAFAASWLARRDFIAEFAAERPQLVAAILGVAAWLLLRPSWLGLSVVIVSLVLAIRQAYLRRRNLAAMSTLIRAK